MADLGDKHECPNCGVKYYDLGKSDAVCPRCGLNAEEAEVKAAEDDAKSKAAKKEKKKKAAAKKAAKAKAKAEKEAAKQAAKGDEEE